MSTFPGVITPVAAAVQRANLLKLRPYQADAKADAYAAWDAGAINVLAVLPTGAGKTVTFSDIIHDHTGPSCAIAHRQELVAQISLALARDRVRHRIIGPANVVKLCINLHQAELGVSYYDPSASCAVAGVDTLVRRATELADWLQSVTLWVQDECFPAGTLVDGRPIETIEVGDYVTAFNEKTGGFEKHPVERLFKSPAPDRLLKVVSASHHVLNCTPGHPFLTKRGWVEAIELKSDDEVLIHEMRHLPEAGKSICCDNDLLPKSGSGVLQSEMLQRLPGEAVVRDNGGNEPEVCVGTNDKKQPYESRSVPFKNVRNAETNRALAEDSRRQRSTSNESGTDARGVVQYPRFQVADDCTNWRLPRGERTTEPLQNRLRKSDAKNSNRGGRGQPLQQSTTGTGREERPVSYWSGLASVSILERGNIDYPGENQFDGFVYNIEVKGLHNYIAEGVVVHNCHHVLRENKWGTAAAMFPNAKGLGVTATPVRADGKGLGRHADGLFDVMVEGPGMRDLINMGYLTDYRIFAPPSDLVIDDQKTGASGDWSRKQLKTAASKSHIVGDVVGHYQRIAPGKLGVVFATDVETATDIAAQFNEAGIAAEVVSAKTPDAERIEILGRFKRRELLMLVNVDLFGEGFDLPAIEVVIMARPTQSFALFVQQFGRALRLMIDGALYPTWDTLTNEQRREHIAASSKPHAIIIDHVGNVERHGLPDARREWTLDRRERRSKSAPSDVIPVRTCGNLECLAVYERVYKACPFCGFVTPPAGRSLPEQVDGDLIELHPATLAELRGEVARVDMTEAEKLAEVRGKYMPIVGQRAELKRHREQQEAQEALRTSIAWWGGYHRSAGQDDSEIYRRFFFAFGVDMLSAQALKTVDALALAERVNIKLGELSNG